MSTPATRTIPQGMHTLTPHIVCEGASDAIAFFKKAFNAEELARLPGPNGKIMHAAVRIGDSVLMLMDDFPEWGSLGPKALKGSPITLHLYVDDVDAAMKQAVAAGAQVTMPVADMFWGDRYGQVVDPFGHRWSIATHKMDLTPEEIQRNMATMGDMEAAATRPRSRPRLRIRPQEVELADLHAGLPQDAVGRRDVEIEVGQREGQQVVVAAELRLEVAEGQADLAAFGAVQPVRRHVAQVGDRRGDALLQLLERGFLVRNRGASTRERRCTANLEASLARCTWPDSGYMSGARRALMSSAGSVPAAAAWAAAFSSKVDRTVRPRMKTGALAWCMDRGMTMIP